MYKKKLGEDHPDTLTSMNNLASTYRNQGQWGAAEELEVQVLEMRKKRLREDHPDTLICMHNLAYTRKCQGRYTEAVSLIRECVRRYQGLRGGNQHDFKSSATALAQWEAELAENDIISRLGNAGLESG